MFTVLSQCLCLLQGCSGLRYVPATENKALLSELLVLMYLLIDQCHEEIRFCEIKGLGLSLVESESNATKAFFLTANPSFLASTRTDTEVTGATEMVLILGNAGAHSRPRLQRLNKFSGNALIPNTIIALGWSHIFHQLSEIGGVHDVCRVIADAIRFPTNYYYANQPSINRRTYLQQI